MTRISKNVCLSPTKDQPAMHRRHLPLVNRHLEFLIMFSDLLDRIIFCAIRNSYYLASKEFLCSYFTGLFLANINIIACSAFIQILYLNYHKHKRWREWFIVV